MYLKLVSKVILVCFAFSVSTLSAATVSWISSVQGNPWVDKGTLTTTPWDNDNSNYVSVDETTTYQEIFGFGGCFNEVGWKVLMKLSQSTRDSIMKLLFDSTGCNFSVCRVPIGANDYSIQPYTYDETSGDTAMTNFSIDHDQQYLIPFMKAATAVRPSLKIWGSPWTVPTWMKDSKTFNSGSILSDSKTFTALALYFAKTVKAFQQQGLHYFAMGPTNEPTWNVSMGYPVTGWTSSQMRDFIKKYLGPRFRADDVNAEMFLGTLLSDGDVSGNTHTTDSVFADTTAYSYCTGAGFQYSMPNISKYTDKRFMETETPCGTLGGFNDDNGFWNYAVANDDNMRTFFNGGVSVYSQWNIVLDTSGRNIANWRQFAPIMVDTVAKKVTFTAQFYQMRHYSFIKPGAFLIAHGGNAYGIYVLAFRNPDGENIIIVTNRDGPAAAVAFNFNGQKIKVTIPIRSFNTFRIAGTPIPLVSAFSKIEAENISVLSGTLTRTCSEGGKCLTYIRNNDWVEYHNIDFGTGAQSFEARVFGVVGGSIEVHIDSCNSPVAGTLTVPASNAWSTVTCPVTGLSGKHVLYLKFKGTGTSNLFNLNWFDFVQGSSVLNTNQKSQASAGNNLRLVVYNGSTLSLPVDANKKSGSVVVYDLSGKQVYSAQIDGKVKNTITCPGLRRGIYIVK